MKIIKYVILFIFMVSSYLIACDSDQTDINGACYFTADLDALVAFATNSGLSTESGDVISMGTFQSWNEDGRLTQWVCNSCNLMGAMPSEIGNWTELTALFLQNNELGGSIPEGIGNLTKLTTLWLNDNELEGIIPSEIYNLNNLTMLYLHNNSLTGIIPNSLCNLPSIFDIDLDDNKFCENDADCSNILDSDVMDTQNMDDCPEDCDVDESPVDGVNCYSKVDLDVLAIFASNSGMPSEYGDVFSMESQTWNENGRLTQWLCYNCDFTGVMPSEIGNLTELLVLFLQDNDLEGPLPEEIGNLTKIKRLYLEGNEFTGTIPSEIGNLIELEELRLYDNNLSGPIPIEIENLTNLVTFNLNNNLFTGLIPSSFCDFPELDDLSLMENKFCPPYPDCMTEEDVGDQDNDDCDEYCDVVDACDLPDSETTGYFYLASSTNRDTGHTGYFIYYKSPFNIQQLTVMVAGDITLSDTGNGGLDIDICPQGVSCNVFSASGSLGAGCGIIHGIQIDGDPTGLSYGSIMAYPEGGGSMEVINFEIYEGDTAVLDDGYIGCYSGGDLEFLQDLITTSTGDDKPSSDLDPWKLGYQAWEDRRLKSFCCSDEDLSTISWLNGSVLASNLSSCDEDCPYAFNASIPSNIGNLSQLDTLVMVGMNFSGLLPSVITSLINLDVLLLNDNEYLTGSLSEDIGNINELEHLSLENNDLFGGIPASLWSLSNLVSLKLNDNRFEGSLPNDVDYSNFPFLRLLDITNNNFSELIPDEICNMNYIEVFPYSDYFMFDGNKFCPPFPDCINTNNENQNATLVSFYEDANQDGIGNEDVTCAEPYCLAYPPMEGDCMDYVSACCDESDACPNNQTRDECGECGGDGFHDDCTDGSCQNMDCNGDCKAGTLFACSEPNCGTAVIDDCGDCGGENAAMDGCGECDGPNVDCSSGYNAQTCPDMNEYCSGSCEESPVCIPQLESMSQTELNLVDINTRIINMNFTAPISYQVDGIEIESHDGTDIAFTYSNPANDVLEIVLVEPLISGDQLEISINPCKIKSLVDPIYQVQYCLDDGDDIPESIDENMDDIILNVALMGDFDINGEVNQYDLDALLQVWKTEDFSHEIGPWEGTPPYLQAVEFGYDGDYDIHDLMGFVQMWNWDYETNGLFRKMESNITMDYDLPFNFKNNQMAIHFQDYPGDMKRAWFQLKLDDSNVQVENLLSVSEFDVVLNGFNEIQGVHDWVLGSFTSINDRSINLFEIHSRIEEAKSFVLKYEIIGFNGEVSHGEINFINNSMPEKIFINAPYPNPYNPVTKIEFGIPEKSNAFMEVHDIQGRLIDDKAMLNLEPGFHAFIWDGVDQPSGIYLIRIKINDRIENFRTMLIK